MNFDGYALGGLSVGEPPELMHEIIRENAPRLPENKPRYVMGIGKPLDIAYAVRAGVDMFDCVIPTRNARNGHLFTSSGIKRIRMLNIIVICHQLMINVDVIHAKITVFLILNTWIDAMRY